MFASTSQDGPHRVLTLAVPFLKMANDGGMILCPAATLA